MCPVLFAVGHKVRNCTWSGRHLGSSDNARLALHWTLSLLLRLSPQDSRPLKYVRTIVVSLLTWTPWMDASPGMIHAEESCEAMLSKVSRILSVHTTGTTHEHYSDAFQSMGAPRTAEQHGTLVSERVMTKVCERLRIAVHTQISPPNIQWKAGPRVHILQTDVPRYVLDCGFTPLLAPMSRRHLSTLYRQTLRTLIGGRSGAHNAHVANLCGTRTSSEIAAVEADLLAIVDELEEPRRPKRRRLRQ